MSSEFARHQGDNVRVVPGPVGDAVRDGILLPGRDVVAVGPSFEQWLAAA
jgi:hypothetical protein